jgi:CheY-like chemotaxis protein
MFVATDPRPASQAPSPASPPRRVLLVDDDPTSLHLVTRHLESRGHHVRTVLSGEEALAVIEHVRPDLIVVDFVLPRMDGIELARRLRALPAPLGTVPIVGVTAFAEYYGERMALDAGCSAFFVKPLDETARRALDGYLA